MDKRRHIILRTLCVSIDDDGRQFVYNGFFDSFHTNHLIMAIIGDTQVFLSKFCINYNDCFENYMRRDNGNRGHFPDRTN